MQNIRAAAPLPHLSVRTGSVVAMVNPGEVAVPCFLNKTIECRVYGDGKLAQVAVVLHGLCLGFGRGKFREVEAGEQEEAFNHEKEVAFDMKDSEDLVMLENKVMSLHQVISERNASTGQASVSYHTMVPKPGIEKAFTLKQDLT